VGGSRSNEGGCCWQAADAVTATAAAAAAAATTSSSAAAQTAWAWGSASSSPSRGRGSTTAAAAPCSHPHHGSHGTAAGQPPQPMQEDDQLGPQDTDMADLQQPQQPQRARSSGGRNTSRHPLRGWRTVTCSWTSCTQLKSSSSNACRVRTQLSSSNHCQGHSRGGRAVSCNPQPQVQQWMLTTIALSLRLKGADSSSLWRRNGRVLQDGISLSLGTGIYRPVRGLSIVGGGCRARQQQPRLGSRTRGSVAMSEGPWMRESHRRMLQRQGRTAAVEAVTQRRSGTPTDGDGATGGGRPHGPTPHPDHRLHLRPAVLTVTPCGGRVQGQVSCASSRGRLMAPCRRRLQTAFAEARLRPTVRALCQHLNPRAAPAARLEAGCLGVGAVHYGHASWWWLRGLRRGLVLGSNSHAFFDRGHGSRRRSKVLDAGGGPRELPLVPPAVVDAALFWDRCSHGGTPSSSGRRLC